MTSLTRESLTDLRTERMLFTFNLSCINSFIIPCRRSFSLLRVPLWSYLFFQLKHVYWCDNIPPILPNNRFYNVGKHAHTHAVVKTEQLQVLVPNGNHVKSQRWCIVSSLDVCHDRCDSSREVNLCVFSECASCVMPRGTLCTEQINLEARVFTF